MEIKSDLCTIVGQNIRRVREAASLTQSDLALMIGSTQSQIGKYERGVQDMSLSRLVQIAEALGADAVDFLKPVN